MDNILCDELIEEIFQKLPQSCSSSLSLVSKRWLHLHRSSTTSLSLHLSHQSSLSIILSHYPFLSSLYIHLCSSSTTTTTPFTHSSHLLSIVSSSCFNLRVLGFHVGPVSLSSLTSLSKACTFLTSLSITLPRPIFLKWVLSFPSLKHLTIEFHEDEVENNHGVWESYDFDDDEGVELGLESVCFVGIHGDDYGVGWLWRRCKKLKRLKLQKCQGIGGSYSCFVKCLKGLEDVEIRTCRAVADMVLLKLAENCDSLNSLSLYDGGGSREALLYFFSQCSSNLNKLDLRLPMDLDNNHLQSMAMNFRGITSLRLQSCYLLSGEGLKAIGMGMSDGLEELALINCDVVGREYGLLATLGQHLRRLTKLDLSHNEMLLDKELISMLVSCVHLIDLRLRGCKRITSMAMVSMLRSCKRLENVDVMNCFGIESEAIEMFIKKSPCLRRIEVDGRKVSVAATMCASNRFIEVIA
ncbi:hypothetical protein Lal_00039495 [Lupinus albus]|uniref:Putative F-box domain, leucine-rich repeat domain, L domain-containing protein n=1 Tax=Lupinus albus TaxID=3870 RepID=A0A6A4PAW0_LUPAL|nr:putative F-box domain, leucine-rich repeat domain, L domain-containing protein [Lupinus albus]KAF1885648.1 hypothetical protein Lal_00039495 [Lupinus albus]